MMMRRFRVCGKVYGLLPTTCTPLFLFMVGNTLAKAGDSICGRYPDAVALQERLSEFKNASPEAIGVARRDFDLAIRSALALEGPKSSTERMPHGGYKPTLHAIRPRDSYERAIATHEATLEEQQRADFYRKHLEHYVVDDSVAMRMAIIDVALNGWNDWSQWEGESLTQMKELFPDLHRSYALQLVTDFSVRAGSLDGAFKDVNGVVLEMLLDPGLPDYVRRRAQRVICSVDKNPDTLSFLVTHALSAEDSTVRSSLIGCMRPVSEGIEPRERKAFWEKHLDCPDDAVRSIAVLEMGSAIRCLRDLSDGAERSPDIIARLRVMAATDPNEQIRRRAQDAIERYEAGRVKPRLVPGPQRRDEP